MISLPNNATIPASLTKPFDIALSFLTQLEYAARKGNAEATASGQFRGTFVSAIITKPNSRTGSRRTLWNLGCTLNRVKYEALLTKLTLREREYQQARSIEARRVPMRAEVLYIDRPDGDTPIVSLNGQRQLHLKGTYHYFGVGAVPRGSEGRREYQGPMVPGPWAYAFGLATVLMAKEYVELRAQQEAEKAAAIEVEHGSLLLIDGIWYRVEVERREFINLVACDPQPPTCFTPKL